MGIEYKNSIEEMEKIIEYANKNFLKNLRLAKYFLCFIPAIVSVYYLITESIITQLIINIMLIPVIFKILEKLESKYIVFILKKTAKLAFKIEDYYSANKSLEIGDSELIINYNNEVLKIKLNKNILIDEIDNYLIINNSKKRDYKYKLIIPNQAFKDNEEKEAFIDKIKDKINKR